MNDYLTLDDLAKRWGLNYSAVVMRKSRGRLPEPDKVVSRIPMWLPETIAEYEEKENGHQG